MEGLVMMAAILARTLIDPVGIILLILGGVLGLAGQRWYVTLGAAIVAAIATLLYVNAQRAGLGLGPADPLRMAFALGVIGLAGHGIGALIRRARA
jgi:hypothetical protein